MLVSERVNIKQHCTSMSGLDSPDSGSPLETEVKPRRSSLVRGPENTTPEHVLIEPEYYMNNYEATVTVHKSPPLARRPTYDFIEIDDETRDTPPVGLHRRKHKKNLKVTFSDQIEIDIISLIEDTDSDQDDNIDVLDSWTDSETSPRGSFSETYNSAKSSNSPDPKSSQADRSPSRRSRTNVIPSRRIETHTDLPITGKYSHVGRAGSDSKPRLNSGSDSKGARTNTPNEPKSQQRTINDSKPTQRINSANTNQPLLQRRKQVPKPLVSDVVHQKIVALNNNNSSKSNTRRFSQSVFPDIVSTLKSEEKYKQFMSGVKRAVDNTRSYERPWLMSNTSAASYQQTMRRHKPEYVDVRRTTSLPKNFKLPENLAHARFSGHIPGSPKSVRN